jgi:hypothetical protein
MDKISPWGPEYLKDVPGQDSQNYRKILDIGIVNGRSEEENRWHLGKLSSFPAT